MKIRAGNIVHVLDWTVHASPGSQRIEYQSPTHKEIVRGTLPNPLPLGAYRLLLGKSSMEGSGVVTCPPWCMWRGKRLANEAGNRRYLVLRFKNDPMKMDWVVVFDTHIPESLVLQLQMALGQLKIQPKETSHEAAHPGSTAAVPEDSRDDLARPAIGSDHRPEEVVSQVTIKAPRGAGARQHVGSRHGGRR